MYEISACLRIIKTTWNCCYLYSSSSSSLMAWMWKEKRASFTIQHKIQHKIIFVCVVYGWNETLEARIRICLWLCWVKKKTVLLLFDCRYLNYFCIIIVIFTNIFVMIYMWLCKTFTHVSSFSSFFLWNSTTA